MDIAALDRVLEHLDKRYPLSSNVTQFVVDGLKIEDPTEYTKYAPFILANGFGIRTDEKIKSKLQITEEGKDVIRLGGFEKYREHQEAKKAQEEENKRVADAKLRDDAKISKWQVKTRWWPLAISAASFIVALTALIMQLSTSEPKAETSESSTSEEEVSPSSIGPTKQEEHSPNNDTLK